MRTGGKLLRYPGDFHGEIFVGGKHKMSRIFDMDSPLMRILNKFADLMWLNILTLICCIPIVTIGPALSAAHYVELKMYRNEEGYITRDFFKAFKVNFKQGFILGVINLLLLTIFVTDIFLMNENSNIHIPRVVQVLIMAAAIMYVFYVVWVYAVQAKFINTIKNTMKNAFAISMMKFPYTIAMVVLYVCPWVLLWISNFYLFPIVFLFGVSAPAYCSAALYSKFFKQLEEKILAGQEEEKEKETSGEENAETEEEKIFSDKPMFEEKQGDK